MGDGSHNVPRPIDGLPGLEEELAEARRVEPVRYFAASFAKAVRAYGLYSRNNEALLKHLYDADRFAQGALELVGDLEFNVRRDRLVFQGHPVLEDADREMGIPFRLFREGVRRFTLEAGLDSEELNKVIEILARPPSRSELDDDLVSLFWREALPHVRYVTLDVFAVTAAAEGETPEEERAQEEIRQDLDQLLGAIYQGGTVDRDGIKKINISSDDLVALATLGDDRQAETERIGTPTSRAIFTVGAELVAPLLQEIDQERDEVLLDQTYDVLLGVLFRTRSGRESQKVIQEILNLYDSLLLSRDFKSVASLVERMTEFSLGGDLKNLAIVQQLIKLFNSEQRLAQIPLAINDGMIGSAGQVLPLLRALGAEVVPTLLGLMPGIQQPQHRRLLCDMLLEVAPLSIELIRKHWGASEWFVDRDLLYLAQQVGGADASELILEGAEHPHARVRQHALGMLQPFPPGLADDRLVEGLEDDDSGVRITSVRTLVARRSPGAVQTLKRVVTEEAFLEREPGEQRTFLVAFATLAKGGSVPVLDMMLNGEPAKGTGFLDRLRSTLEATVDALGEVRGDLRPAAAVALSVCGTPEAVDALHRGARSRNKQLRELCERALARRRGDEVDDGTDGGHQP